MTNVRQVRRPRQTEVLRCAEKPHVFVDEVLSRRRVWRESPILSPKRDIALHSWRSVYTTTLRPRSIWTRGYARQQMGYPWPKGILILYRCEYPDYDRTCARKSRTVQGLFTGCGGGIERIPLGKMLIIPLMTSPSSPALISTCKWPSDARCLSACICIQSAIQSFTWAS